MSENAMLAIVIAACISSCTACTITDRVIASNERVKLTPQQMCVRDAWTHADKIDCLNIGAPK